MKPRRIWISFEPNLLNTTLRRGQLDEFDLIIGTHGKSDPRLAEVEIAFGQPHPEQVIQLPNLKWVHLNTAGYTPYDRDDLRSALRSRSAILTNSSSVFDEPCAQHALAMILSLNRRLPQALTDQRTARDWPANQLRSESQILKGQTVLLVGFGAIGKRLAELLSPFHLNLVGFRRQPRGDDPIRCLGIDELDKWLPTADHVVNLLPASASSDGLFDEQRFAKMKPSANFYNIGRGTTVNQEALQRALESNKIAAAYIDVTTPEPLPKDHPLWTTPNCFITPHTAGGHAEENERVIEHFAQNLKRYEQGDPLIDRIV